ncbi:MAG: hypothetical protein U9Q27_00880 [Patescibacteria group bacterium]|nr:hypothetical protein [Patescibacteria group bacterium]
MYSDTALSIVEEEHPLKQGLKPFFDFFAHFYRLRVEEEHPLKHVKGMSRGRFF